MSELDSSIRITSVCATAATLAGVTPSTEVEPANALVTALAAKKLHGEKTDRTVIYNPDAVALWLYQKYTDIFTDAALSSDLALPLCSVMPSVTPVCFASMYTGVMPAVHGIQKYEKPVLKTETLFDLFLAAGKRVAIVSTAGDSISKIFLEREMEYYIYPTVDEVNCKAMELIEEDRFDLIAIYNGNYDGTMHKCGTESPAALAALQQNVDFYAALVEKIRQCWKNHRVFYGFCPDHGCHEIDAECGSHGLDMPEDMNVIHFYGIKEAE
ncbi:MAG: hypothetical protein IJW99_04130 [Clostridia bacterium]|nr:hypothetical protein [Clostridia bacterium]